MEVFILRINIGLIQRSLSRCSAHGKVPVDKADRVIASKGNAGSNKGTMEILSKDESNHGKSKYE